MAQLKIFLEGTLELIEFQENVAVNEICCICIPEK